MKYKEWYTAPRAEKLKFILPLRLLVNLSAVGEVHDFEDGGELE